MDIGEIRRREDDKLREYEQLGIINTESLSYMKKCKEKKSNKLRMLKVVECVDDDKIADWREMKNWKKLMQIKNIENFHITKPIDVFSCCGRFFLVFDYYSMNLGQFMEKYNRPLSLSHIRVVALQMLNALAKLRDLSLIHTDVSLKHIMFTLPNQPFFQLKLIDFKDALTKAEVDSGCDGHNRALCYQSPEIIVGASYDFSTDVWCLGIVLAFLVANKHLFNPIDESSMSVLVHKLCGPFPHKMLCSGVRTERFFNLELINNFQGEKFVTKRPSSKEATQCITEGLSQVHEHFEPDANLPYVVKSEYGVFYDLLEKMIRADPKRRLKPIRALQHPFVMRARVNYPNCDNLELGKFLMETSELRTILMGFSQDEEK